MGNLTIRNLDDGVIDRLKARAKANQRSLEGEVRHMLAEQVDRRSRMAGFRQRTQRLTSMTAGTVHLLTTSPRESVARARCSSQPASTGSRRSKRERARSAWAARSPDVCSRAREEGSLERGRQ